jgi:hypothetical protein
MRNRLDTKAKRGAIVKSLAFGSKKAGISECCKAVAGVVLDKIFDAA